MTDPTLNPSQEEKPSVEQDASVPTETVEQTSTIAENTTQPVPSAIAPDPEAQKKLADLLSHLNLQTPSGRGIQKEHKFWKTQPVAQYGSSCN
jgi:hypothetical protein